MSDAIRIEGVGKKYRLGESVRYDRQLVRGIESAIGASFRRVLGRGAERGADDDGRREFWALRDVSLSVPEGQVIGMVGANGAGKSTLLKMLARITPPTEGRITIHGQVGSLLEVGTGFHPELTGRENIYLNGSILGMRRHEINARFEEIVDFSGIEEFIDTPVKRYSSGMFIRLAFSVASHFEPEILLIDEVLSVGDAQFQRKCLKKMESIAHSEGRTIVFVSHSLPSVQRLCDRVALIEDGRLVTEGPADTVIADYMQRVEPVQHGGVSAIEEDAPRSGTGEARLTEVSLCSDDGTPIESVRYSEPFTVAMKMRVDEPVEDAVLMVVLSTADNTRVFSANSTDRGGEAMRLEPGTSEVQVRFEVTLLPGEFVLDVAVLGAEGGNIDYVERAISLSALNVPVPGSSDRYPWTAVHGSVRPEASWSAGEPGALPAGRTVAT